MTPEALAQLVGSGNAAAVEEELMRIASSPDGSAAALARYAPVLEAYVRNGKAAEAEELAWSVIEALMARGSPDEALSVAGRFLLAIGESDTLRGEVAALFRKAYPEVDGLEALLSEAGLEGGRPVRRALRTLEVCLKLRAGDYLVARDEDEAARVESIDPAGWTFVLAESDGQETYGAVHLADRYRPGRADEFRVLKHFSRAELDRKLQEAPASIVIDICRGHHDKLDSEALEALLVPDVLTEGGWKKWWSRARTALKRCPNIRLEGRSPYTIEYVDKPICLDEGVLEEFKKERDPALQVEVVESYLRECRGAGEPPSETLLRQCLDILTQRGQRVGASPTPAGLRNWCCIRRLATITGLADDSERLEELLRAAEDPQGLILTLDSDSLLETACDVLFTARPQDWRDHAVTLLPALPTALCDSVAVRLLDAGVSPASLEPVVQRIMSDAVASFDALLWLWDRPSRADGLPLPAPITVLMRILRTLEDARLQDHIDRETTKRISARARAVLSARSFERFDACLTTIDAGMAAALRTQLRQQEALGRAVREDLLHRLDRRFPPISKQKAIPAWERDDVLFVTEAGMTRKLDEIDHHVNVTMRENAAAIGRAAEHGDLSENSEYKFALEERDLLRARLAQMNAEMAIARVRSSADVPADHIGFGSRALFQRTTDGVQYQLTFVGPWEADGDRGLINYKAPLAQRLMGKRIGDIVDFDHSGASGQYELVALENGLA